MIVGYTCGVYDILHEGHINLLKNAKSMCDTLIVGLTTDEKVNYKGKYPVMEYRQRKAVLESVKYVDSVIPQYDHDKFESWKRLKFDILFVGDDWYATRQWSQYEDKLNEQGVKVVYFPYTQHVSTTLIKKHIVNSSNVFLVFDLDHTLWPLYTNLLSDLQFESIEKTFTFSDDIIRIFKYIKASGLKYGFASRSRHIDRCAKLLLKLDIVLDNVPHLIMWTQEKTKAAHITDVCKQGKCSPEFVILFDDDQENIDSVSEKICYGKLIEKGAGLQWEDFIDALYNTKNYS